MLSLFKLRKAEPNLERTFRAPCYPLIPLIALVLAVVCLVATAWFNALIGLISTALSDYRQLRAKVGLQRYSEAEMVAKLAASGFSASRAHVNIGHNPWRMTFVARHAF